MTKSDSEWTVSTLREHLEALVDMRDKANQQHWKTEITALSLAFHEAHSASQVALIAHEKLTAAAFLSQEKAMSAALFAAGVAVQKAEVSAEKRFDAINDFRGQLSDQAATFLPRSEFDRAVSALNDKLDVNAKMFLDKLDDVNAARDRAIGAMSDKIEALSKASSEKVDLLRRSQDKEAGKAYGFNAGWGYLVGVATVAVLVLQAIFAFIRK